MDSTSISLLRRLRGDRAELAWERFVELYAPLIYHWTKRAGLADDEVADCVQEVLIRLVEKLPSFRYDPAKSFRAWLRTVTQNQCHDHYRRRPPITRTAASLDANQGPSPDHVQLFTDQEYRQLVSRRALSVMQSEFEETTWRACWGQVVEGESAATVAERLGITANAAYLAKSRVLRRLRQELEGLID